MILLAKRTAGWFQSKTKVVTTFPTQSGPISMPKIIFYNNFNEHRPVSIKNLKQIKSVTKAKLRVGD